MRNSAESEQRESQQRNESVASRSKARPWEVRGALGRANMPPKKAAKGGAKGKGKKVETPEPDALEQSAVPATPSVLPEWDMPKREVVKPANQLTLTDEELGVEYNTILKAANPEAPHNVVHFSFSENEYKPDAMVDQGICHYSCNGWLVAKDSDEGKQQIQTMKEEENAIADFEAAIAKAGENEQADEQESKQYRNQFNFVERAAQTYNNTLKDHAMETEPPLVLTYSGSTNQWEIYDAYVKDLVEKQTMRREAAKAKAGDAKKEPKEESSAPAKKKGDLMHSEAMAQASRILERLINQNIYEDITQDFKYWDDQADSFRDNEGTLLPLWKFANDTSKRKNVTALCWNTEYFDLFAVGYGSFDFAKQGSGLIRCYSLKNPSFAEFTFKTESGVMCLDFHPQYSSLLAVGLYDGTVMVYDIRSKVNRPLYASTAKTGKHTDPVWQIRWEESDMNKAVEFYSISSDGRVTLWTMTKSEL